LQLCQDNFGHFTKVDLYQIEKYHDLPYDYDFRTWGIKYRLPHNASELDLDDEVYLNILPTPSQKILRPEIQTETKNE
jgi:hypothetical protein